MRNKKRGHKKPVNDDFVELNDGACSFEGPTDSEDEYSARDRELLLKARTKPSVQNYDSDDEVYGLGVDGSDDEEDNNAQNDDDSMESDVEGLKDDLDLPNERAWGRNKRAYYSTDYVDPDYSTLGEQELAEAELEEQEARAIQKRLAEQLDDADFELDILETKEDSDTNENEQIVKTDLSKLSKRQKQALIIKESPEFLALVADFKDRVIECRDILAPFLKLAEKSNFASSPAIAYIQCKYQLLLNYCVNISFYLMLKAKRLPVTAHPVIKQLAQYRQLISQMEAEQDLLKDVQKILEAYNKGLPLYSTFDGCQLEGITKVQSSSIPKTKTKDKRNITKSSLPAQAEHETDEDFNDEPMSTDDESQVNNDIEEESRNEAEHKEEIQNEDEDEEEKHLGYLDNETKLDSNNVDIVGKRAITYQMAKNKGLTPYRKKELRNPRVKHRNKYRKAKIRRKGAVREVRRELTRYAGEISGIKAGVKKSIKLK